MPNKYPTPEEIQKAFDELFASMFTKDVFADNPTGKTMFELIAAEKISAGEYVEVDGIKKPIFTYYFATNGNEGLPDYYSDTTRTMTRLARPFDASNESENQLIVNTFAAMEQLSPYVHFEERKGGSADIIYTMSDAKIDEHGRAAQPFDKNHPFYNKYIQHDIQYASSIFDFKNNNQQISAAYHELLHSVFGARHPEDAYNMLSEENQKVLEKIGFYTYMHEDVAFELSSMPDNFVFNPLVFENQALQKITGITIPTSNEYNISPDHFLFSPLAFDATGDDNHLTINITDSRTAIRNFDQSDLGSLNINLGAIENYTFNMNSPEDIISIEPNIYINQNYEIRGSANIFYLEIGEHFINTGNKINIYDDSEINIKIISVDTSNISEMDIFYEENSFTIVYKLDNSDELSSATIKGAELNNIDLHDRYPASIPEDKRNYLNIGNSPPIENDLVLQNIIKELQDSGVIYNSDLRNKIYKTTESEEKHK